MKRSVPVIVVLSCGIFAYAQGTSSPPKPPASSSSSGSATQAQAPSTPSDTGGLKVRGPEAVAKQDPNKVVATIDGHPITAQQAVNMLKQIPDDQRRTVQSLSSLLQQLYTVGQLSDEAEKLKLDQQSPWREQIQLDRKQVLAKAYLSDISKSSGGSASEAQQYYSSHPGEFEQLKMSGILIAFNPPGTPASGAAVNRTEAEAQQKANDLEKKIKDGGDFSALARTDSDQQQSAAKGGDLGGPYLTSDPRLPPDIKTAVAKLQPGQVSEPVRVTGGYFILKLDKRSVTPFEEVRAQIVQKLQLEKYKIQVQDPDFFASSAPSSNLPSLQRPASPGSPKPSQTTPPKPPAQ